MVDIDNFIGTSISKRVSWLAMPKAKRYEIAEKAVIESGNASASFLQRKIGVTFSEGIELIEEMEKRGIVSAKTGKSPRIVYCNNIFEKESNPNPDSFRCKILDIVDRMDGHDFEYWCANILRKNGFTNVDVTPGSGDHGVDVLAEKDGVHYAIQCKCYSNDLGNSPVQEVYAGKEMYHCQVGVVMTNRYFTSGAKQLAQQTRVLLWDRDKLKSLIESAT